MSDVGARIVAHLNARAKAARKPGKKAKGLTDYGRRLREQRPVESKRCEGLPGTRRGPAEPKPCPDLGPDLDGCEGGCGRKLRRNNFSGFCDPCRARLRCATCNRLDRGVEAMCCPACRRAKQWITESHMNDGGGWDAPTARGADPDREARVARLAERAEQGLPLFGKDES